MYFSQAYNTMTRAQEEERTHSSPALGTTAREFKLLVIVHSPVGSLITNTIEALNDASIKA